MASDDEYDALPDVFESVDWDAIDSMTQSHPLSSSLACDPPPSSSQPSTSSGIHAAGTPSSEDYGLTDVDDNFLGEVDALERSLVASGSQAAEIPHPEPPAPIVYESPKKTRRKKRSRDSDDSSSPQKKAQVDSSVGGSPTPFKSKSKGKRRQRDVNEGVKKVLEEFEDDLSCPICCDIFACAHLGIPCGHSFCGECGYDWLKKSKSKSPTCAICRSKLSTVTPMVPNFALDNAIEKHVQALAASGAEEWGPGGTKCKEWTQRREKWKASAGLRAAEANAATSMYFVRGDPGSRNSDSDSEDSSNDDDYLHPDMLSASVGRGRGRVFRDASSRAASGSTGNVASSNGTGGNGNRGRSRWRRGRGS